MSARPGAPAWTRLCLGGALLAFAVLRAAATWRLKPVPFADTWSYEHLSGGRPPTVPLLYALLQTDQLRVIGQTDLGIAAWAALAVAVAMVIHDQRLALVAAAAVLALGLRPEVSSWDRALLSESVSISLSVLLLAALLHLSRDRRPPVVAAVLGILAAWALTRDVNALLLLAVLPVALIVLVLRLPRRRALALCGALVLIAALGASELGDARARSRFNEFYVVVDRVLADPAEADFFKARGLPVSAALRREAPLQQVRARDCLYATPCPLVVPNPDTDLQRWLDQHYETTLAAYLLQHPGTTVSRPFAEAPAILSAPLDYATTRVALPWPRRDRWLLVLLLVAAAAYGAGFLMRGFRTPDALPLCALAACVVWYLLTWQLSATELARLTTPIAVVAELACVILIALSFDRPRSRTVATPRPAQSAA